MINNREVVKQIMQLRPSSMIPDWALAWICDTIRTLPAGSSVLEMGTFTGGTTYTMAIANKLVNIHSIDLNDYSYFKGVPMFEWLQNEYNLPDLETSDILELQKIQTEDCPNIKLYTGDSVSLDIDNLSLVLVDSNHKEDNVTTELNYIWPRLIEGGYIFGDDADNPNVFNAFVKFAKEKNIEIAFYSKVVRLQKINVPNDRLNRDPNFKDVLAIDLDTNQATLI